MWDVDAKGTRFSVVADSYVGVLPDSNPLPVLLEYFGACEPHRPFPADVVAICGDRNATTSEVVETLIEDKPDSKGDDVQRYYYALVKESIQGYPFPNLMSEEDLYRNMSAILEGYQTVSPRISTFYVKGNHHVFLKDKNFTSYKSDTGLLLGDVINEWLASNSSLDGGTADMNVSAAIGTPSGSTGRTLRLEGERSMIGTA